MWNTALEVALRVSCVGLLAAGGYATTVEEDAHVTQNRAPGLADEPYKGTSALSVEEIQSQYAVRVEELRKQNEAAPMVLDRLGGWVNAPESLGGPEPGGYFRVAKKGGAWWFVTPEGHPFVSKGVTDVHWMGATHSGGPFHEILVQRYGTEDAWADASRERMLDWGFNSVGPWSSSSMAQRMAHGAVILDVGGANGPRHPRALVTDYWDVPFAEHAEAMVRERATPHVEDKNLLGYFLDNEIVWGADHFTTNKSLLQLYLDFPEGAPGRNEALRFLRESAGEIKVFNEAWGTRIAAWPEIDSLSARHFRPETDAAQATTEAFMLKAFDQYATVAIGALRRVDPNHLILGCRFHNYPGDAMARAAAKHFDVISMAFYEKRPPVKEIDAIYAEVDKPFLIEEWTFKSDDSGIDNPMGIYAPEVRNQMERGLAYGHYVEDFMRRPYGIGYHWYKWMDNPVVPAAEKRYSGDNCGLLNQNDEPYRPFVEYVREVNRRVESWHAEGVVATADSVRDALRAQEARLSGIESALADAESRGIDISYPKNDFTVARMFVGFGREDAAQARIGRAVEVATEIEMLLDRAEAELEANRIVPRLAEGPISVRDGSFWSETDTAAGRVARPVFLTGYGHFVRLIEDIPLLAKMGINFIQFELGPALALTPEGGETGKIEEYVLHALDRAREHGVRVDLLLSPHQNMPWWHEHWPEAWLDAWPYVTHVPFIKWSVDAPQIRKINERYLRTIIPRIKDHPALNSVCLTNEPDYRLAPQDPWRLPKWIEYLREIHGEIETLNANYGGTTHQSFEAVGLPRFGPAWYENHPYLGPEVDNLAWLYDGIRFNQREFSGWHAWMRDIIHEMAPGLPVHAKVMPVVWGRYTLYWGTDPYQFAQLSQLNGNDCYFEPTPRHAPWQSTWQVQNMYYDMQRAMKNVPVVNTENHIIPDRFEGHVSADHIYTAIWQGAVHGQGASATWTWERTFDPRQRCRGAYSPPCRLHGGNGARGHGPHAPFPADGSHPEH